MMFSTLSTFIGVDPTAGVKPFTYAALDQDLRLLALGQGRLEEILAFAAGQRQAVLAVCAPRRPNQGVMDDQHARASLTPVPRPGRWNNFRLCEYLLRQHHISAPQTPADERRCPRWMRMGFTLFHRLENLGYHELDSGQSDRSTIEVYPHASFTTLLGQAPFPKLTLEGRLQRQLVLFEHKLIIPDPMRFFEEITRYRFLHGILPMDDIYAPGELDALVGAYTAWLTVNQPEHISRLGDAREGQIILPVNELKPKY
jgi:hypothetical protein